MLPTVLTNADIVLDDRVIRGSVVIKDGQIADVSDGISRAPGSVGLGGDLLIPGLIELHTDNIESHIQPRPNVDWPHAAAIMAHDGEFASVGATTAFDAMRLGIIEGGSGVNEAYARQLATKLWDLHAANALRISHFLHLRAEVCSATLMDELAEFGPNDRVGIVSLMDHTPGQRQFRDISKLKTHVQGKRGLTDPEFDSYVTQLSALRAANGDRHKAAAEAEARRFGAVLASHDDTTAEDVRESAARGVRFAEFPTTAEAARACHDHGIAVMMGAPNLIRGGSHSGNVAAHELAEAGLVDILSSDYVPSALIHAAFLLADFWDDLPRAIATVTSAPASAAMLEDRGRIACGLKADLVRVARIAGFPVVRAAWSHGRQVG